VLPNFFKKKMENSPNPLLSNNCLMAFRAAKLTINKFNGEELDRIYAGLGGILESTHLGPEVGRLILGAIIEATGEARRGSAVCARVETRSRVGAASGRDVLFRVNDIPVDDWMETLRYVVAYTFAKPEYYYISYPVLEVCRAVAKELTAVHKDRPIDFLRPNPAEYLERLIPIPANAASDKLSKFPQAARVILQRHLCRALTQKHFSHRVAECATLETFRELRIEQRGSLTQLKRAIDALTWGEWKESADFCVRRFREGSQPFGWSRTLSKDGATLSENISIILYAMHKDSPIKPPSRRSRGEDGGGPMKFPSGLGDSELCL
jgi:hypothetical protein